MDLMKDVLESVSRRSFLKTAGIGVASMAATPAWARVIGANDRLNVAVIGLGGRGSDLLSLILQHRTNKADVEVVALCDVYQKRLNAASQKVPGAKTYTHHQDLLQRSDIDAVFIATPDQWHAPITMAAMLSGKDVYVEKPITHTLEEAKVVAHKAAELNRVVQVGVQGLSWRRWPKIRQIIQSGMIGQVVAVQGTYSRNDPAGDWNWPIDAAAGPNGVGENHIDWEQWLGSAPKRPFDADRFFRFRKYWDYSGGIATDLHYHIVAPFHVAIANEFPTKVAGMGGLWVYTTLAKRQTPSSRPPTIRASTQCRFSHRRSMKTGPRPCCVEQKPRSTSATSGKARRRARTTMRTSFPKVRMRRSLQSNMVQIWCASMGWGTKAICCTWITFFSASGHATSQTAPLTWGTRYWHR